MIAFYGMLGGYGGDLTGEVIATFGPMQWGDDTEPIFEAVVGTEDEIAEGHVAFDFLHRRCAPISRAMAMSMNAEVVAIAEGREQ